MKRIFLKTFLLSTVSLLFLSCSNILGLGFSSDDTQNETPSIETVKYVTITGKISLPEELTESGALPEDYLFIHNVSNSIQNRSAFPATPTSTDYYVTATATGETTINVTPTETESGATFSITLPVRDTEKSWSIEAGLKADFNGSPVIILKDIYQIAISSTNPTFNHDFVLKPLETENGETVNGDVALIMSFQTEDAADELELYFDNTKITAGADEDISPTNITLKNRPAGAYKAKLVFKKNGYVVFSDYEGINIFPNMTTNTWHHNGGDGSSEPIDLDAGSWRYYVTNASIASYMLTQIYVGNTNIGGTTITASDTTGNGTVFAPFATFAKAIDYLQKNGDTSKAYTIWISGEITGAQTISDGTTEAPTPVKASSLTISGVTGNTSDSLKGGSSGSVLYLDTSKPVKITNLTITGGKGTTVDSKLYGGGIYINKGSVELTTGVVVDGNTANVGGGVYLVDGTLYLNDTAVVGKPLSALGANPTCAGTTSGTYANKATEKGGGISINAGTLWLGYRPPVQGESQAQAKDTSGGVIYNLVTSTGATQGGGIDNYNGIINIARGVVSYNYASGTGTGPNDVGSGGGISTTKTLDLQGNAEISHNESAYGGAVYIGNGGSFTMSAGTITENASKKQHTKWGDGGGIAIGGGGNFYMSGGTVSSNTAEGKGGAVYHTGTTFEISGNTATIPKGDNEKNNIQLETTSQKIKITGPTNSGDGGIALTPARWNRGDQIFADGSTTSYFSKFKLTDSEWSIVAYNDGTNTTGRIDADIYVASTAETDENRATGISQAPANASDRKGTKSAPFATLTEAVDACWASNRPFTINVSGTVTVTSDQSIGSGVTASAITITGVTGDGKDVIDRGLTNPVSSGGHVLTIATAIPITIEKLTLKRGYTNTANGAGIYVFAVKNASLTLGDGALITGNTSGGNYGGGIYFEGKADGKANLFMLSGSSVSGNKASSCGGGVYLNNANLCMTGTAKIGDAGSNTDAATNTSGKYSNYAGTGGGVYADTGSAVYLGYKTASIAEDQKLALTGGIFYNYASYNGGGVNLAGDSSLYMNTGNINQNGTSTTVNSYTGGGVRVNTNGSFNMTGGTINKNNSYSGGGIYFTIGKTVDAGTISNNSAIKGGGIFVSDSTEVELKAVALTGNSAASTGTSTNVYGGGVYNEGTLTISGNSSFTGNSVSAKANAYGGGIYTDSEKTLVITSDATNLTMDNNSVTTSGSGKKALGGAIYNGGILTLNAGKIGNTTMNTVTAASGTAQGGAIYHAGTEFNISGSINCYNSGNTAKKNDVFLTSGNQILITGKLTYTGSRVAAISTEDAYSNGTEILKGGESIGSSDFSNSMKKMDLTGNTIYGIAYKRVGSSPEIYYGIIKMIYEKANPTTIAALGNSISWESMDHDMNRNYIFDGEELWDEHGTGVELVFIKVWVDDDKYKYYVLLIDDWEQSEVSIQWTVWDEDGEYVDDFDLTIDEDGYLNLDMGELEEDYDFDNTWISVNKSSHATMESYSIMYVYWIPY